jgi:hypothetical protein
MQGDTQATAEPLCRSPVMREPLAEARSAELSRVLRGHRRPGLAVAAVADRLPRQRGSLRLRPDGFPCLGRR